ncbi:MAG: tRNA lysidine(34) synthetase TilS [Oscillospiraceae bacterium]|nr:tRNA lysidine(34) synthetase TilS [Oscillospiraceae bacterium]
MLASIKNFFQKHALGANTAHPYRNIVALSGGADSVCLLYALYELKDELGITLEACHVNHMLRGKDSDADEEFVQSLCKRLDIPLFIRRVNVKSLLKSHESVEECARNARYSFFSEIGANAVVATAHTADDNAETVLLNMVRGTGLRGLCGIPPVRYVDSDSDFAHTIIRPMIEMTRADVLAYLKEKNAEFITDLSNFSDEFTRNYLRHSVIPSLEKINPSFISGLTGMCIFLRSDDEYLQDIAQAAFKNAESEDSGYEVSKLIDLHPAVLNRIISLILSKNNISPSALRINGIVSILGTGGKINLVKDKFAVVQKNFLSIKTIQQNYRKN